MMSSSTPFQYREHLLMDREADRRKGERVKNETNGGRREIIKD